MSSRSRRVCGCQSVLVFGVWFHGESIVPQPAGPDHDQRLKVLLKEFFEAFFLAFFPNWAARFEFHEIDWLDKELFLAPPQGEKRQLDLVARLKLRPGTPPPRTGVSDLVGGKVVDMPCSFADRHLGGHRPLGDLRQGLKHGVVHRPEGADALQCATRPAAFGIAEARALPAEPHDDDRQRHGG